MIFLKSKHQYLLPIIPLLIFSNTAYSAGFALVTNSASGMGNSYAGSAAVADNASTIWFNPAGMTYLGENISTKSQLSGAAHIISAKTEFSDKGSASPASLLTTIDGKQEIASRATSLVPNLYYMRKVTPRLNFGLSVNAPFGSSTKYQKDWVGRYQATESKVKTLNINPSLSWKANQKLSIGGGVSVQQFDVNLGKALDSAAACRSVAIASGSTPTLDICNTKYPQASRAANDSQVVVEGDDVSFGFNVGALFQATPKTRLGLSYRSKVKHNLEGKIKFDLDPTIAAIGKGLENKGINTFKDRDITATIELPESLSLSLAHQLNQRVEILGDITWTGWSSFEQLLVNDAKTNTKITNTPEDWKNVTRVSLGANYNVNHKLTLRTGVAFDEEPIPSAKLRTPNIPGNDRTWISLGAGYKMNKKLNFDVGYAHLFLDETPIDNTDEKGYAVKGLYNSNVNILSAQVNYNF